MNTTPKPRKHLSDTVKLALIASVAPTIVALGGLIVGWRSSDKLIEIHTLTNSNLSTVTTALQVANEKVDGLRSLVAEQAAAKDATLRATEKDGK